MTENQIRPNNYLVLSILSTIFCCWPLGIPAIIQASKVNSKFAESDYAGAQKASESAKKWMIWNIVIYFLLMILIYAFVGFAAFASYLN